MRGDLPVTLEITPPASPRPAVLLRRASLLGARCGRVNVIQRPDRWSSLEASIVLSQRGFDPVWHLANRGRSIAEIEDDVARASQAGLQRALCIRGEHKAEDHGDTPKIRELVRLLRRQLPDAQVSVTLNHHGPPSRVVANLAGKLDAGAHAVQTQVTFDLVSLEAYAALVRERWPDVSITPMLMPVLSARSTLRLSRRLAIPLPAGLLHRLELFGSDAGWEHFGAFVRALARTSLYDGVAVMTPIDPDPHFAARLVAVLDEAGTG